MFGNALSGWHLIILLVVILLLFGAPKLPGLARSLGQSMRIFRSEVKTMKDENSSDSATDDSTDSADSNSTTPPKP
ncbi:Sec-independent protein translocase subunit TatA [Salinibacterium sp. TMP30]|uniref:Sec-independent protein translocase subunit TatA n=1 Tax=Salinibacterium sp. TMP30 TaxID=3138237 RepID=UPI0031388CD7